MRWVDVSAEVVTPLLEKHLSAIRKCYALSTDVLSITDEIGARKFDWPEGVRRFTRGETRKIARIMDDPSRPEAYAPATAEWLRTVRRGRVYVACLTGLYNLNFDPQPEPHFEFAPGSLTESPQDCALRLEHAEYLAEQARLRAERERGATETRVGLYGIGQVRSLGPPPLWRWLPM